MRRLLTTLMILLVVVAAGISALLLLINPNDFRAYMIKQVQQRTGYRLTLDGDLRWRVWPQLSILSDRMSLRADGAEQPVIAADNMRLDVRLWPLLSHQLEVRRVMLKGAVIRLTPASEPTPLPNAPRSSAVRSEPISDMAWRLNIHQVKVEDSLVIWQAPDGEPINLRDIELNIQQDATRHASVDFSSRINRDQRDLQLSLQADVDLSRYPQQYRARIDHLEYRYSGAGLPSAGIAGQGSMTLGYSAASAAVTLSDLTLSANDSQLRGEIQATLDAIPEYRVTLQADNLDWDSLSGWQVQSVDSADANAGNTPPPPPPVVSQVAPPESSDEMAFLRDFSAWLNIQAKRATYHGMAIEAFALQANNRRGMGTLESLSGRMGAGEFAISGTLQSRPGQAVQVTLDPRLRQLSLAPLLGTLALPAFIDGSLSLSGHLQGEGLSIASLQRRWQGSLSLVVDNARLEGMNIAQLIQQAVVRDRSDVQAGESVDTFTTFQSLKAAAALHSGLLTLNTLNGHSPLLDLGGSGSVDLAARRCDITLGVRVLQGWTGHGSLIDTLQKTSIPLHIYGDWQQLNYQIDVDKALRDSLEQQARDALKQWLQKRRE
ncbi:outer membrane assembly protein AsmA [Edwardsiella ictaluri]|uniref:AsmA family protein n=1 Tax=Edwardsiella ictaluri (strain 93-146) TaxID=634503 RepID=C5BCP1_EDWI9|nr:outer membrane assembly protein AsmA [Edwardsiella ictaluri]ACR68496.2 AsmA family protein [Edwardsiella ictaluri 93-146]AVZ81178.1 outer membrane assembly protein AsmA [Edwardsiella ictaluri]EKS7763791.1 outer membrane assembly protein AsmA [Edwardsiella ictaluri]EKS7770573.1 outer membrane assembly protein AsmA [Edwardsiella ictaluri]EKS7773715.1 outer membrane assembly protein AsmA [Edwardsiella ictaluri]